MTIKQHAPRATHRGLDFRSLAETAHDALYRFQVLPDRRTEYVNPAIYAITGRQPEEFYSDPYLNVSAVHPDDRHLAEQPYRQDGASIPDRVVLRWVHPTGRVVWAEHRRVFVRDQQGRIIAFEGDARDVTEWRAAERKLQENEGLFQDRLRRSEDQLRRLAGRLQAQREEDRATVARELHDDVGQTFTSLKLELAQAAQTLVKHGVALAVIDQLQALMGIVDVGAERVRRLASDLRPAALDHLGLGAALEFEAAAIRRRTGLRVRIRGGEMASRLHAEQDTAVFRIVQEALTNTIRHASASAVLIRMFHRSGEFIVRVIDNGRGIRADELDDAGAFGLLGMRERAQLIGGRLLITGKSGRGTKVSLLVPIPPEQAAS